MTKIQKVQLGERHKRIMEILELYQETKGYSPAIRDICERINVKSTSHVNYYLDQLEENGFIHRDAQVARSIRPLRSSSEIVVAGYQSVKPAKASGKGSQAWGELISIRIQGTIQAGAPLPVPSSDFGYLDAESSVEVASSLLPVQENDQSMLYALKVQGDSMVDAMVNDGDIIIMKPAKEAHNGEMVAIWLNDVEETTLKYFYLESGGVRLEPANPNYKPIYYERPENLEIKGKLVLVIRQMK